MASSKSDLEVLFEGFARDASPPRGRNLIADPQISIELAVGQVAPVPSQADARAFARHARPRVMPRITKLNPFYHWIEFADGEWLIVEYSKFGEAIRGRHKESASAWQHFQALKRAFYRQLNIEEL